MRPIGSGGDDAPVSTEDAVKAAENDDDYEDVQSFCSTGGCDVKGNA